MTAAATRKLQKEMENVIKKAEDGITEFTDYYNQATSATNAQQKERLGEELKKSINKLQRFRSQIREWIAQNQIASLKGKLEDVRKRIENDMQLFKDFERELKTKAFSKCALARQDELELEEEEKLKYQEWLTSTIQALQDQLDQAEADLEVLEKKRSLSSEEKSRRDFLQGHNARHRWHIKKLEHLLRAVDNDAISISDLAIVRDSVDMYVEEHDSPDQYHDELLYDCFDLAEFEAQINANEVKDPEETAPLKIDAVTPGNGKESVKEAKKNSSSRKEKELQRKEKLADRSVKSKGVGDDSASQQRTGSESKTTGPATRVSDGGTSSGRGQGTSGGGSTKSNKGASEDKDRSAAVDIWEPAEMEGADDVKVQESQLISEADEFICRICQVHVVSCGPLLSSCSHLFCGDCIRQWFTQHPQVQTWAQRAQHAGHRRVVPCPVCKNPLTDNESLFAVSGTTTRSGNLLLWRMLSSLPIACSNHPKVKKDGRCDWVGELGQFQEHIRRCQDRPCREYMEDNAIPELTKERYGDREQGGGEVPSRERLSEEVAAHHVEADQQTVQLQGVARPALEPQSTEHSTPQGNHEQLQPQQLQQQRLGEANAKVAQQGASEAKADASEQSPSAAMLSQAPQQNSQASLGQANIRQALVTFIASEHAPGQTTTTVDCQVGDRLWVQEACEMGWAYVRNLEASPAAFGWVPSWVLWPQSADKSKGASSQHSATVEQLTPQEPAASQTPAQHCQPLAYNGKVPERLQAAREFQATLQPTGAESGHISVKKGDWLDVCDRHHSGWTFGRVLKDPSSYDRGYLEGWFPDWVTTSTSSAA